MFEARKSERENVSEYMLVLDLCLVLCYVYKTNNTLVLAVYVAVVYLLFLICICVLTVVLTIAVQHLYLRSETKPFTPIPAWVSVDNCVYPIR